MSRKSRSRREFEAQPPRYRLGDGPVERDYRQAMAGVMQALDEFINGPPGPDYVKRTGIIVMMFPYGEVEGRCNFMSNGADRRDVVTLMKEMIARFEGQPEITGKA
jgi:hypothetical protein